MATKIFELKLEKVTESWRKFHADELREILLVTKYCSVDLITKNERVEACEFFLGGRGGGWKWLHGFVEKN
jgi:hypothetical protein